MTRKLTTVFIITVLLALAFRLPGLSFRTMHGDEAVNALKYSELLEKGTYQYDPSEYHGPSLYYFTLPVTYITSQYTLQDLTATTLRIVPIIFCLGLLIAFLLIRDPIGHNGLLMAATLLAISPFFVFYSRYYIHEMLFLFFSYFAIFSAFRLYIKPSVTWSVLLGMSLALMMATKETWIIILISAIMSFGLLIVAYPEFRSKIHDHIKIISLKIYIAGFISFVLVYILFFTSFLRNMPGILDSLQSIWNYTDRSFEKSVHVHPWYQYIKWLIFSSGQTHFWSEGLIAVLGITGIFYSFNPKQIKTSKSLFFMKFLSIFTLLTLIIFSVILYKTPWNALSFWLGMIILAGFGFAALIDNIHKPVYRNSIIILVIVACIDLGWQSYQINFTNYEDPDNPYVYAQPQKDIFRLLNPLQSIAKQHPEKKDIYIQVIMENDDYWPLPWYLKNFKKVGWWNYVNMDVPSADIIITGPEMEKDLIYKLYNIPPAGKRDLYVPLLTEDVIFRPGVKINAFVKLDIYNLIN